MRNEPYAKSFLSHDYIHIDVNFKSDLGPDKYHMFI